MGAGGMMALGSGIDGTVQLGHDMYTQHHAEKAQVRNQNASDLEWHRSQVAWQRNNEYNKAFWHEQNKYNSPEAQMDRLRKAGLNPRLMYGSNAQNAAGQASNVATANQAKGYSRAEAKNTAAGIKGFQGFSNFARELAQINNIDSSTEVNKTRNEGIFQSNRKLKAEADVAEEMAKGSKTIQDFEIDRNKENLAIRQNERKVSDQTTQNQIDQSYVQLQNAEATRDKAQAEAAILGYKRTLSSFGVENADSFVKYITLNPDGLENTLEHLKDGVFNSSQTSYTIIGGMIVRSLLSKGKWKGSGKKPVKDHKNKANIPKLPYNHRNSIKPNKDFLKQK